jgi:lysophospholipase
MNKKNQTLRAKDGTELAYHRWPCPEPSRGEVLVVHGVGEHMLRYVHLAKALNQAGFQVSGVDLRGHGQSSGKRGHVARWDEYVDDLRTAAAQIGQPFALIAHSMGALVSLDYLRSPTPVHAVVLSGPLLGVSVEAPRWKTAAAGLLSKLLPALSMSNEIDPNEVCAEIDVVARYQADPLTFSTVTPRWYVEMRLALARVHAHAPQYRQPLSVHFGGDDRIVSRQAIADFVARWGGPSEVHRWPNAKHEVFNEAFQAQVFSQLIQWLLDQEMASSSSSNTA